MKSSPVNYDPGPTHVKNVSDELRPFSDLYKVRARDGYRSGTISSINVITSTSIHARAWKDKALAGYNSQQIPTNNNIHKMLMIIISLRWKHFVIISYLYKIPIINDPYNQRKRDIKQTHTDILTA